MYFKLFARIRDCKNDSQELFISQRQLNLGLRIVSIHIANFTSNILCLPLGKSIISRYLSNLLHGGGSRKPYAIGWTVITWWRMESLHHQLNKNEEMKRLDYIDIAKCFAILCVVIRHSYVMICMGLIMHGKSRLWCDLFILSTCLCSYFSQD